MKAKVVKRLLKRLTARSDETEVNNRGRKCALYLQRKVRRACHLGFRKQGLNERKVNMSAVDRKRKCRVARDIFDTALNTDARSMGKARTRIIER